MTARRFLFAYLYSILTLCQAVTIRECQYFLAFTKFQDDFLLLNSTDLPFIVPLAMPEAESPISRWARESAAFARIDGAPTNNHTGGQP